MGPWSRSIVLLAVATTVLCTPLINKLEPGKEWPTRECVKQPLDYENEQIETANKPAQVSKEKNDPTTVETEAKYEPVNVECGPKIEPTESTLESNAKNEPEEVGIETKIVPVKVEIEPKNEPAKVQPETATASVDSGPVNDKEEVLQEEAQILPRADIDDKIDYTGAQVWKVTADKNSIRTTIVRLRRRNMISTWGGNHSYVDVFIKPNAIENVTRVFKRENISYEVVIDDLQRRINEENPPLDENEIELQDRQGHRMTWKQYHRLADIHGFMDYLAKTYPSIVSVKSIGKSYEGRDLKVIRISNGKPTNKAVFIDGGIHAREWISPATVTYFINQFAENFDVESDDIKDIDWYFLPVVNPDGYEYTHVGDRLWRKNRKPGIRACIGTDLNRNFGYRWGGKGASGNPCSEIYRGSRAFSEPESRALSDFIKNSAANFSAYLTYHSYGQYLLYPWGYDNAVPPDHKELDVVGKNIAQAIQQAGGSTYQVGSSSGLLYPASGGSDDWAKGQGIKYTYTIELSDTGRYGFVLPTSFIVPVAKESLAGLRLLAKHLHTI